MKTRMGFVSNSSSSSFVLIGKRLSGIYEVLSLTDEEQKKVRIFSYGGYDGVEMGRLTPELLADMLLYEPYEINETFDFWYSKFEGGEEYGKMQVEETIEIGDDVLAETVSMHSSWEYYGFHSFMKDLGYGDQRSDEEKRLEEVLGEN